MSDMPQQDPLAALRPLHPPAPIDWWPPAPGWWLLGGVLLMLLGMVWWYRRRWRLRRVALAELQQLERTVTEDARLAAGINQLLRRVALACFPRQRVAALSGEAWLAFLDEHGRVAGFSSGPGRVLLTAPFTPNCTLDRAALVALARQWIRQQRGSRP